METRDFSQFNFRLGALCETDLNSKYFRLRSNGSLTLQRCCTVRAVFSSRHTEDTVLRVPSPASRAKSDNRYLSTVSGLGGRARTSFPGVRRSFLRSTTDRFCADGGGKKNNGFRRIRIESNTRIPHALAQ